MHEHDGFIVLEKNKSQILIEICMEERKLINSITRYLLKVKNDGLVIL